MRISTTTRYSVMAMIDIAVNSKGEPVSVSTISERQGIPVDYLEQLFLKLRKAGLVKSIKGFNGGFLLKRPAKDISVADVIKAAEGHVAPIYKTKTRGKTKPAKDKTITKRAERLWIDFGQQVEKYFSGYSLEKLAKEAK